jgi:hypothetical protein
MTVTSSSFFIEGDYKILWSTSSVFEDGKTSILKEGTAPKGSLAVTSSFPIPEAPAGLYYVGFIRLGRDEPTIFSFTVVSHLSVLPLSTSPGGNVTINGTGLPSESVAPITLDGNAINTNGITNKNGTFIIDFSVPNITAGEHVISATSSKVTSPITPATILVIPTISANPPIPQAGNSVTITGRGFAPKVLVSIIFNDIVMTNSPSTDDTGSFTYNFTLPQSANSGSKFTAKDASGNTAVFAGGSKIITPPPTSPPSSTQPPTLIPGTPAITTMAKPTPKEPGEESFGLFGAQPVKFKWTQATSFAPNTITYILEVSDNAQFSPIKKGMRAANITQTSFTLNLQPGKYYWRVKAVNANGVESDWAYSRYSFKVGKVPLWLLIVGILACIVVLFILVRSLLRRQDSNPSYYY